MKIIDLNNVERIIKDCPVIVSHTRKNSVVANKFENIDGELVTVGEQKEVETEEKYAQVPVIGKQGREWVELCLRY
jgi:phosphosulfolactate phosphohydrolase-like enzyme